MFQIATLPKQGLKTDSLVIFMDQAFIRKRQKRFDRFPEESKTLLKQFINYKDFEGHYKQTAFYYAADNQTDIERLYLIGVGYHQALTIEKLRNLGYLIAESHENISAKRIHIYLCNMAFCREDMIRALAEGILYFHYRIPDLKTDKKKKSRKKQYIFVCDKKEYSPRFRKTLLETRGIAECIDLVRDIANEPANRLTPPGFVKKISEIFEKNDQIKSDLLSKSELIDRKFNGILAVAQGSPYQPYLVTIRYTPQKPSDKTLAFVGKGVTFDSGGISIKPASNMHEMKYDMAGAASVVGIIKTLTELQPKFSVVGVVPIVENMADGKALKPGDILTMYNGKTVEVVNTDAEGRLILADALAYVKDTFNPDVLIDFATLTGSCVVALGDKRAGLFCNDRELSDLIYECGEESGDRVWPMPLDDGYKNELKSDFADIKNLGGRWGGAIFAAKFLEQFVGDTKWAHIDIAGTAYGIKDVDYLKTGATGFGVRLAANIIKSVDRIL
ncbi:MAG: leucyl aminopeptidase [Caldithrix sp.]|nr:leucyl aminopeptidase [Caldithrix sp.]